MNLKFSHPLRRALLAASVASVLWAGAASGEDLLQVYREAQKSDPALASARANWEATQERVPQARAGLLPNVALSGSANVNNIDVTVHSNPNINTNRTYNQGGLTFSASQPLYRPQNVVLLGQAKEQVNQADYTLAIAQQDLIIRTAVAYFDVLLAEFNIELVGQQKIATIEQLAQAKRNFEVGTATITDTNEAQARFDQINASEIQFINELDRRRTALRAIIGRFPSSLKRVRAFEPMPPSPNTLEYWVDLAVRDNLGVRVQQANVDIATLEIDRARAGHYPTLDLVGSFTGQASSGSSSTGFNSDSRQALLGLQLNVPLYQGGFVNSRVRESIALLDRSRADLETVKRAAISNAQDGFSGVNSAVASVKAFEQAAVSADVALQSNILGQEVGIRTNLDVLNVRQNVYQARRDVANAYFTYLLATLRLKAATGALSETDLEALNRRLQG
ncbi:MAG: TolC family outer membrane protein [Betaproteobacteria bacterium]